jgi:hypothetical protein
MATMMNRAGGTVSMPEARETASFTFDLLP